MFPYIDGSDGWTGRPGCQAMSAPACLPQWAQDRGEVAVSWLKNAEDVLEDHKKSVTHSMVQSCSIMVNPSWWWQKLCVRKGSRVLLVRSSVAPAWMV